MKNAPQHPTPDDVYEPLRLEDLVNAGAPPPGYLTPAHLALLDELEASPTTPLRRTTRDNAMGLLDGDEQPAAE